MELCGIRGALPFAAFGGEARLVGGEARLAGGAAAEPQQQRPGARTGVSCEKGRFPVSRAAFDQPGHGCRQKNKKSLFPATNLMLSGY